MITRYNLTMTDYSDYLQDFDSYKIGEKDGEVKNTTNRQRSDH